MNQHLSPSSDAQSTARNEGIVFLVELGFDETEALAWAESLNPRIPEDVDTEETAEHALQRAETRLMFHARVGLSARAGFAINSVERLGIAAHHFRSAGFTCAASVLHLINLTVNAELASLVHQAGASRGDVPYVIEAARAVMPEPPVEKIVTWVTLPWIQNRTLTEWFSCGIPARWVPRYLAAGVGLDEALAYYEPQRIEDHERVLDAMRMLAGLRRGVFAA